MPRPKRPSDELYNARRRVRRLAERVAKQGDTRMAEGLRDLARVGRGATIETLNSAYQAGLVQYPRQQAAPRPATPKAKAPKVRKATQPRPHKPSDDVRNARRRLERQANRIEREAQQMQGIAQQQAQGFADYLRKEARAQKGKKLSPEQRQSLLDRLASIRKATREGTYEPFRVRRRNMVFMQQLNAAGTKDADSSISERQKDVFWAATKGLWTNADIARNERYDAIASYFYNLSGNASSTAREFQQWLKDKKGKETSEVFGDLQLVFEYVTTELNNPANYDSPDIPYGTYINRVIFAR